MNPLDRGLSGDLFNLFGVINAELSRSSQASDWVSILLALFSPSPRACLTRRTLATFPEKKCKNALLLTRAMSYCVTGNPDVNVHVE